MTNEKDARELADGVLRKDPNHTTAVYVKALLLIDETFREATYGGAPPAASFAGRSDRLLTCASLSKAYGVPGLRIGWLTVADPRLREQLRLAKFNSSVCCGVLDEFLATRLLSRAGQLLGSRATVMARPRATVDWTA